MVDGVTRGDNGSGTSLRGYVTASYSELVTLLGEPQYKLDVSDWQACGDGKRSTEWILVYTGRTFTLYDYKETSLYDSHQPTPEEFRAQPSYRWHVGGTCDSEQFINALERALMALRKVGVRKDE